MEEYAKRYAGDTVIFAIELWNEMSAMGGTHYSNIIKWNEDCTFNLECGYMTEKIYFLSEITYLWRDNSESVTRDKDDKLEFFKQSQLEYIIGQCYAMSNVLKKSKIS